jgi:hypothetical protein
MSSVVFLISMGFVVYFLIQGDKKDRIDREAKLVDLKKDNKQ